MNTRSIAHITSAPLHPCFLGPGHLAAVVDGRDFPRTDPFIFLYVRFGVWSLLLHRGRQAHATNCTDHRHHIFRPWICTPGDAS